MTFAVDDIVFLSPKDTMHPAILDGSARYGRILAVEFNGKPRTYLVDIAGIVQNFIMEEADLAAVTGPISSSIVRALVSPSKPGRR